jgi:hypothetical protein
MVALRALNPVEPHRLASPKGRPDPFVIADIWASRIPGITATKDMLNRIHTPVIYIFGGPTDIAYPNGTGDFARLNAVPAALANLPVGHGGTFSAPMGGAVAHVAVDWLEWQLKGDKVAARTVVGDNCRLCTGTDWSIERKGL